MADECPHSTFVETTLKECHDSPSLVASTHESYLKIINELKNDLELISCEFVMAQNECRDQTDDVGLADSLRELEVQNDRLEQALKLQTQTKEAALAELQTNNETLKCQIDRLQRELLERDEHIAQLTNTNCAALLSHSTTTLEKKIEMISQELDKSTRQEQLLRREIRQLTDQLNESIRKNKELINSSHRLVGLLKCQESHCLEFAAKYKELEKSFKDQTKKLRAANTQLFMLEQRFQNMEKKQYEHNLERNFLREEVLSLKEKLACAIGRQKSIEEQLLHTENELYTAHDALKRQTNIMQQNESSHNDEQRKLQEINAEQKSKLAHLAMEYKRLQEEHDKQKEINAEQLKLLGNFRKWKEEQLKAEQSTRDNLKMCQNYIADLLQENKKLLNDVHELSKEYSLLQNELERLKMCPLSVPTNFSSNFSSADGLIHKSLETIRRTTRRFSEQTSALKDEELNASRSDSSLIYKHGEDTS